MSTNLISAIQEARENNMKVFSIVAKKEGFAANNSDVSIVIPVSDFSLITPISESFQSVIWHCIVSHPSLAINATKW